MKNTTILSLLLCVGLCMACGKKSTGHGLPDDFWPWVEPEAPADPDNPADPDSPADESSWTVVSSVFGELPEYVQIKASPEKLQGVNAIAYIAEIDLQKTSFEVWGINAPTLEGSNEPLQTPSQVYEAQGNPCVIINAGYFFTSGGKSYSSSLEVSNGTLLSPNINYESDDWITIYSPTRAAFIEHSDGTYEVCWTFWANPDTHYIYDVPAENSWSEKPLQAPDASFPCTAREFEAKNAIGGSPVLLKGGVLKNTYKEELINIGADGRAPRTAIALKDKKLVLFVCEGRNMTEGVPGFTTEEVAKILLDYGCTDAVNLDGGGSTLMLVNGQEVLKPSDGNQRAVASCVYIK
ncbi:MAG: phosphodiester glycosidase family protein [Candidatus Cryptobacteroides sp.]